LRAKNKKEPITVLGVLYRDGLDIDEFSYDGFKVSLIFLRGDTNTICAGDKS